MPGEVHYDYIEIEDMGKRIKKIEDYESGNYGNNDCIDVHYRFKYPATITIDGITRQVNTEVTACFLLELQQMGLSPGELIYKTTLLPGEKVRLFSLGRFSDTENSTDQNPSAEQYETKYYLKKMNDYLIKAKYGKTNTGIYKDNEGHLSNPNNTRLIKTIFGGPSVEISGCHSAQTINDFFVNIKKQIKSSHKYSIKALQNSNKIHIGEVQSRITSEVENMDHYESYSRMFRNLNQHQAVTYYFYQIIMKQMIRFELKSVQRRVIDEFHNLDHVFKETAFKRVDEELMKEGIINHDGCVPDVLKTTVKMNMKSFMPTKKIMVKGRINPYRFNDSAVRSGKIYDLFDNEPLNVPH
jgi:hypothetical protein